MSLTILWRATGSKHDGTGRRMARMIYQKSLFFGSPGSISFTLLVFLTMRPSVKARVCEDMSMPVVRGVSSEENFFVAHRHSYTIVEPFMDHQLNGAHSQAVLSPFIYFFHPWNLVVPVLSVGMN